MAHGMCMQIGRGVNKFAQTIATASLMSDVDAAKNQIGGEVNPTASWVLAHFRYACRHWQN